MWVLFVTRVFILDQKIYIRAATVHAWSPYATLTASSSPRGVPIKTEAQAGAQDYTLGLITNVCRGDVHHRCDNWNSSTSSNCYLGRQDCGWPPRLPARTSSADHDCAMRSLMHGPCLLLLLYRCPLTVNDRTLEVNFSLCCKSLSCRRMHYREAFAQFMSSSPLPLSPYDERQDC